MEILFQKEEPGTGMTTLFSSSLKNGQNKLECFSLARQVLLSLD